MIRLTLTTGKPLVIFDPDCIAYMRQHEASVMTFMDPPMESGENTAIVFKSSGVAQVRETPDEILALLNNTQGAPNA